MTAFKVSGSRLGSDRPSSRLGRKRASSGGVTHTKLFLLLCTLPAFLPCLSAQAAEGPPVSAAAVCSAGREKPIPGDPLFYRGESQAFQGSLSVLFDNDCFAGNDNRYTAGFAFVWTSAAVDTYGRKNLQLKIVNAFSFLPTVGTPRYRNYLQLSLGMEMYTPRDITVPDPPCGQHPYAGVIHLDSSIVSMNRLFSHQFTLRLGWVGPASGAEEVQTWFHNTFGSPDPRGWDCQLSNEPIVNLFYRVGRRLVRKAGSPSFGFDLTANGGGGLGNYYIGADIGLMARVGYRLPDTYPGTPIFGKAASLVGLNPPRKRVFFYVFLEGEGFGVLRWLPMDGNTFSESRSIDRNYWMANLSLGLAVGYGRAVLAYTYHGISGLTGFETIPGSNQDSFGTLLFTVFIG